MFALFLMLFEVEVFGYPWGYKEESCRVVLASVAALVLLQLGWVYNLQGK